MSSHIEVRIIYHSLTLQSYKNSSNLTFGGYSAGTTPILSVKSSLFVAQVTLSSIRIVQLAGDLYGIINTHFYSHVFQKTINNNSQTTLPNTCERPRPWPPFIRMLGQTHVNGWSRVIVPQNGGLTNYILQWSCHLFNYWKNKKIIIEKFLILLIRN